MISDSRLPSRVVVEGILPQVDCGRFPIKRVVGEHVTVTADIHADGESSRAGRRIITRQQSLVPLVETPIQVERKRVRRDDEAASQLVP